MIMESMENTVKQKNHKKGREGRSEYKQFYNLCTMIGNTSVFNLLKKQSQLIGRI